MGKFETLIIPEFRNEVYKLRMPRKALSGHVCRRLFSSCFQIIDEKVRELNLGKEFLTPEVRSDLKDYPEGELFSNQILFVLKPRQGLVRPAPKIIG